MIIKRTKILPYLFLSLFLIACLSKFSNETLVGTWHVEIIFNDENSDEENDFIKYLSMHPLSNIFKGTKTISFYENGTLIMDNKTDQYPNYYYLDGENKLLYLSFSPIGKNPTSNRRDTFTLNLKVLNSNHFLLNIQSNLKQQLVLKKKLK